MISSGVGANTQAAPFTLADAQHASDTWGANCGPGALAAILRLSLDAVRPHLDGFDSKRYTNPSMMLAALRSLGQTFAVRKGREWPLFGLARVQWEGPWTMPGVPMRVRYRHTHWIACDDDAVFDINCICVGGWVSRREWTDQVVPWLLSHVEPKANGLWHLTHAIELPRAAVSA